MKNKLIVIGLGIIIIVIGGLVMLGMFNQKEIKDSKTKINENYKMRINVGKNVLDVELVNNTSVDALIEKLKESNIVVDAQDHGNFEKYGNLGFLLPTNDEKITTESGDLILYQGDKIALYYDTNTWDFTRLGKIKGVSQEELKEILGSGNVKIELSLEYINSN